MRHRIVIVGGGTAGITVAASAPPGRRGGRRRHRPGRCALLPAAVDTRRWGCGNDRPQRPPPGRQSCPRVCTGSRIGAVELDPDARTVVTEAGARVGYDVLVLCPGLELAWDLVPGLAEAMRTPYASTNYTAEFAPKTWEMVRRFRGGNAVFGAPGSPIKCPGAPQKAAYLSCDHWRRTGVLSSANVVYATGAAGIFGVPEFAQVLESVVERYGIDARFNHELVEVDPDAREAVFETTGPEGKVRQALPYDLLHTAPPQRAPAFVRESPLGGKDSPFGWVTRRSPHAAPHALSRGVLARRRLRCAHVEDRCGHPQPGAGGRRQRDRHPGGSRDSSPVTTGTPPARSRRHGARCCWPSSTTAWRRTRRSRSSTPSASDTTCGCSSATGCPSSTGTSCSAGSAEGHHVVGL